MGGPTRIDQTPVRLNTKITEDRQTPKTDFGSRMKDGLSTAAGAVAAGASVAAPLVPGGAIISAAVSGFDAMGAAGQKGAGRAVGSGAYGVGGGGTLPVDNGSGNAAGMVTGGSQQYQEGMSLLAAQQSANMQFITLQNQMQQENQKFSTLSNVIKVRHDTAKNSIQNIR